MVEWHGKQYFSSRERVEGVGVGPGSMITIRQERRMLRRYSYGF
jgi:putative aminopeptidase FrvX